VVAGAGHNSLIAACYVAGFDGRGSEAGRGAARQIARL